MTLEYKGSQVPWVTRWTGEVIPMQQVRLKAVTTKTDWRIGMDGETPDDYFDDVLWNPEKPGLQGVGTPMFRDVNSHRQRLCQVEGRCQVCGNIIEPPVLWLIPAPIRMGTMAVPFVKKERGNLVTDVAPVCEADIPVALAKCPHLGKEPDATTLYEVKGWRPHALYGDIMRKTLGGLALSQGEVPITNPNDLRKIMARQMVVELWDYRRRRL